MKNFFKILTVLALPVFLMVILLLVQPKNTEAAGTNLILNPSVENSTRGVPNNWFKDKWGTNSTIFTYKTTGQSGSKSVAVQITAYTSGDAKWGFKEVAVTPNTSYTFSDYYISNVQSQIVAEVADQNGSLSYYDLGTLTASSAWKNASFTFTTPANAKTVTIYHLINRVGILQTDNFSFTPTPSPTTSPTSTPMPTSTPSATPAPTSTPTPSSSPSPTPKPAFNVSNSSVEQSTIDPQTPDQWSRGSWGTNSPVFTYLNNLGHTGTHSVKTEITSYSSGDAKWFFAPILVTPGQRIAFSDFYESNITSRVVVEITHNDGSQEYLSMKDAPASSNWALYSDSFTVPANAKTATVFHLISAVGYLITDDYDASVSTQSSTFTRPLVTLTFDDGLESQYTNGLAILQKYNLTGTFYIITGDLNTPSYMTTAMVQSLKDSGQEIGSHTISHPHLNDISDSEMDHELKDSQIFLQANFGVSATSFAPPYGDNSARISDAVSKYYTSLRGVLSGYNTKNNLQLMNLLVQDVTIDTTPTQVQDWVNQAQSSNSWLILVYHAVDNSGDQYGVTPQNFDTEMQNLKQSGVAVVTVNQAINEILPQL